MSPATVPRKPSPAQLSKQFLSLDEEPRKEFVDNLTRTDKARLFYHLLTEGEYTRQQVGKMVGLSAERVRQIMADENMVVRLKRGRRVTVQGVQKNYWVSDRLNAGYVAIGDPPTKIKELRQVLAHFKQHPDQMVKEDIGQGETRVLCTITGLSQADLDLIALLTEKLGMYSESAVIRNAFEFLIQKHNLTRFKKPKGWQSRPLIARQSPDGVNPNPIPRIGDEVFQLTLSIPPNLAQRLEPLKATDYAQRTRKLTLSSFIRGAIDQVDPGQLESLDLKRGGGKKPVPIDLSREHIDALEGLLLQKPQFDDLQDLLIAIIQQAADRANL